MTSKVKRTRRLRNYPKYSIEVCLDIVRIICIGNDSTSISRVSLAQKLGTTPKSSNFTDKVKSCERYGFTVGKYNSDTISVTNRGENSVQNNDLAKRKTAIYDAAMHPEIFKSFYNLYKGESIPGNNSAIDVLQQKFDISMDDERAKECWGLIMENGLFSEIIVEIGKDRYVDLSQNNEKLSYEKLSDVINVSSDRPDTQEQIHEITNNTSNIVSIEQAVVKKTVFLGHVGSSEITDVVINTLDSLNIEYKSGGASGEVTSVLTPFIDQDMRDSEVSILIFANSDIDIVAGGKKVSPITPMLVQLGAALALHGKDNVLVLKEKDIDIGVPELNEIELSKDDLQHLPYVINDELVTLGVILNNT